MAGRLGLADRRGSRRWPPVALPAASVVERSRDDRSTAVSSVRSYARAMPLVSLVPLPSPLLLLPPLLLVSSSLLAAGQEPSVPPTEADALRGLRLRVLGSASGKAVGAVEEAKQQLADDAFAQDVCSMKGVTCADEHISVVSLRKTGLSGPLPLELQMFSHLKALDVSHNQLDGPIPRWLTNFHSLEKLNLAENRLSGALPLDLSHLTSLDTLIVADNALSGVLPNDLAELYALRRLDLAGNSFTGRIPAAIGALPNLQRANWQHGERPLRPPGCAPCDPSLCLGWLRPS
jgi:Leucine-rich repeat (LRR) protein